MHAYQLVHSVCLHGIAHPCDAADCALRLQTKERHAQNVKRGLVIGGSIAAIVLLILLMAGVNYQGTPGMGKRENLGPAEDAGVAGSSLAACCRMMHTLQYAHCVMCIRIIAQVLLKVDAHVITLLCL